MKRKSRWWHPDVWVPYFLVCVVVLCFIMFTAELRDLCPFSPERVDLWKYSLNNPANFSTDTIGPAEVDHPLDEDDVRHMIDSAFAKRDSVAKAKAEAKAKDTMLIPYWPVYEPVVIPESLIVHGNWPCIGDTLIRITKPPYNWNRFRGRKP